MTAKSVPEAVTAAGRKPAAIFRFYKRKYLQQKQCELLSFFEKSAYLSYISEAKRKYLKADSHKYNGGDREILFALE